MQVRRLSWVGTRTTNFDQTKAFFGAVLGLNLVTEAPGFAMFQLPGGEHDYVEVFASDDPDAAYMTTGPVPGFLVDDVVTARTELEAEGFEMVEPLRWMVDVDPDLVEATPRLADYGWFAFRGPDGHVYNVMQGSTAIGE
jgi:catechol 2,3-dioxygenase-like lactoylglutathione lyase family enzyme